MVPERVPGELRDEAMILMAVPSIVGEDDIGRGLLLQRFEVLLDLGADIREESVAKPLDDDLVVPRLGEEQPGAVSRLALAFRVGAEHDPVKAGLRASRSELQDRATAGDIEVVGLRLGDEQLDALARAGPRRPVLTSSRSGG